MNHNNTAKNDLLSKLHEQFSVNQNDTFARFTTLFIALFTLFGGYGIAFGITTQMLNIEGLYISTSLFLFFSMFVLVILGFLICQLIYMGFQHRRDQFLNNKIRMYFFYTHMTADVDDDIISKEFDYFFGSYKGTKKKILSFIPDNLLLNISILSVLKVIVVFCIIFVSITSFGCPERTPSCKKPITPPSSINHDTLTKVNECLVIQNNQIIQKESNEKNSTIRSEESLVPALLTTILFIIIIYSICIFVLYFFYKKYRKLEDEFNKTDLRELIEIQNKLTEGADSNREILQQLNHLITTILKNKQ